MRISRSRKICILLLAFTCYIAMCRSATGETVLCFEGSDKNSTAYHMFTEAHPECTVNTENNIFRTTNEIISALITGEFPYDTFAMTSSSFDVKKLMQKGYCADMTTSSLLIQSPLPST